MRVTSWFRQKGGPVFLAVFGVLACCLTVLPGQARAAGVNLTLSPLPVNLVTSPGSSVSTSLKVQNSGSEAVKLQVTLMKFKADSTNGQATLVQFKDGEEEKNWVTFSKTNFTAQPGVFNTVDMTINPPASAAFGYYYAVVFSQQGTDPTKPQSNKVNGAVASLILLDVQAPGEKREAQVTSFTATKKLYQYLPASFDVTVKNTGNVHVKPSGNIFVGRGVNGNFIDTLTINPGGGNILPGSSRTFNVEWDNGFPAYTVKKQNGQIVTDNVGKPVKTLNWNLSNLNHLRFGKYNASLTLVYNDGKRDVPVNGQVSFWVIPWLPILIILVLVLLALAGLWSMLRHTFGTDKRETARKRYSRRS